MTDDLGAVLAKSEPRRMSHRLRPHMALLEDRHRAGVTYMDLTAALAEHGITVQPETLRRYLAVWRKSRADEAGQSGAPAPPDPSPETASEPGEADLRSTIFNRLNNPKENPLEPYRNRTRKAP